MEVDFYVSEYENNMIYKARKPNVNIMFNLFVTLYNEGLKKIRYIRKIKLNDINIMSWTCELYICREAHTHTLINARINIYKGNWDGS